MVKWKNLKDHYVKSLRTGRRYIHAEELSFLGTDFNFRRGGKVVTNAKSALRLGSLLNQTPNNVLSSSSHSLRKRKLDPSVLNSDDVSGSIHRYDDSFRDSGITFKLEPVDSTSDNDNSLSEMDGADVYSGEPFDNEISVPQEADINILNVASVIPENRHLCFFKGLLPSLQDFNDEETLDFQAEVINVLRNIKKQKV